MPLTPVAGPDGKRLLVGAETAQGTLHAQVWRADVGRCRLFLLDADVDRNGPEARHLSRRLYGGDQNLRIQQEILLGIGGLRALHALGITFA